MSKQEVYVTKMKAQLDELNTRLQQLEASAEHAREAAGGRFDEEMARLREQSRLAGVKLDELSAAAAASWHQGVAEMEKLRHVFIDSFKPFKSPV